MAWVKRPTQRAPDWWESARFQAGSLAQAGFRQSGVVSSHPPAGTHRVLTQTVGRSRPA